MKTKKGKENPKVEIPKLKCPHCGYTRGFPELKIQKSPKCGKLVK